MDENAGSRRRAAFLDQPLAESLGVEDVLRGERASADDVGLRFYLEVLELEHLHYGLWERSDPLTLEGLRRAQERYLERLLGLIPEGVVRVLDVGCGAGANAVALHNRGLEVEGLSPEAGQGERFRARTGGRFHHCRFEDFEAERRFDLVLMSESAQYVPLGRLFPTAVSALAPGGWLLVSDYFVVEPDGSYITRSGHELEAFLRTADASGFEIDHEEDVTDAVAQSLDLACRLLERYFIPSVRLGLLRAAQKKPGLTRWAARFLRRKLRTVDQRLENLDSELFRRKKRYKIYRMRVAG